MDGEEGAQDLGRGGRFSRALEAPGEVQVGLGEGRIRLDGRAEATPRLRVVSLALAHEAQVVEAGRVAGALPRRPLELLRGFGQPALFCEKDRQVGPGLRVLRIAAE